MKSKIKQISSLSETNLNAKISATKTREQWQQELLDFGFIDLKNNCYAIPHQANPLLIAVADSRFIAIHGTNPRIIVPRNARKDQTFMKLIRTNNIEILESSGYCISGYDFPDLKSVKEIGSFLSWFENEYRAIRAQNKFC